MSSPTPVSHTASISKAFVSRSHARILRLVPTVEEKEQFDIEDFNTLLDKNLRCRSRHQDTNQRKQYSAVSVQSSHQHHCTQHPLKKMLLFPWRAIGRATWIFETRQTALAQKQYRIQQKLRKKQKEMEELKIQAQPYQYKSITKNSCRF